MTRRKKIALWIFGAVVGLPLLFLFVLWLTLPSVAWLAKKDPTTTTFIDLRRAEAKAAKKDFRLRWEWRPLARISPYLQRAVVLSEDPHFPKHHGIDWGAVWETVKQDLHGRKRGASTITQQVAKNLFLSPSRNPIRKLREMMLARRLENDLSKKRILEIYLNVCEWGDGVFGAEAAARRWFGTSAAGITPAQAARLAVALPNPRTRSPENDSPALAEKAGYLVYEMLLEGTIDKPEYDAAMIDLGLKKAPPPPPAADATASSPAP